MNRRLPTLLAALVVALSTSLVSAESHSLTLGTALRLAGAKNLALEMAQERVSESRSQLDEEKRRLFPWLAPGLGYKRHDGNLQDIVGDVFDASKQSGSAALTVQAQLELGDSVYRVLAAKQAIAVNEAGAEVRRRETLLAVAVAYTELSRAAAHVGSAAEAQRISLKTLEQVRDAVAAGLAFAGDVQRVEVQTSRAEGQVLEARHAVRSASARLAQLLRLSPADELLPDLSEFVPVVLVATNRSLDSLVASAIGLRPEFRRADATVNLAGARRQGATKGVWMPTLGAQAAFGGMAGGRGGDWASGGDFQDYGLGVSWRIGPGGIGDRSRIRTADSRLRLAELEREQLRDEVTREVVEVRSLSEMTAAQIELAGRAVAAARRLVELTRGRREYGVGVVLEAIEAERELTRAMADQLKAVSAHNRTQWELWHVSGGRDEAVLPKDIRR